MVYEREYLHHCFMENESNQQQQINGQVWGSGWKAGTTGTKWLAQISRTVKDNAFSWNQTKETHSKYSYNSSKNIHKEPQRFNQNKCNKKKIT